MFSYRLWSYLNCPRKSLGFFPDISRILGKYQLSHYMEEFARLATFPKLNTWKSLVKTSISRKANFDYIEID